MGAKIGGAIPPLGIDVGTGGTRAAIIDEKGRILASASEEHVPFESPRSGWAEQEPRDWWRAAALAVRKAMQAGGLDAASICCVGFSGQTHGAVWLDENAEVIRPALIWCDQRTEAQCNEAQSRIFRSTGEGLHSGHRAWK
jgi:xylulokinase